MQLYFNDVALDTDRFELRNCGEIVPVEPKVLDFLVHLATNPNRVITKDEIIDQIWAGRIVSEATISGCVKAARRAVGDNGKVQTVIKTVHGRGFRFVATIENPGLPEPGDTNQTDIFVQPSLLVLPAGATGGEQAVLLGAQVCGKLITALARIPFLTVISSRVSAGLADSSLKEIRQAVGVGYILDVSLHASADQIDANLQLSDTVRGGTIWAHQFNVAAHGDCEQDFLAQSLPRLEPALGKSIYDLLRADPTATGSKPLMIQALGALSVQGWHGASFAQAETLLRRAVELEPDFAMANATLALILALGQRVGFATPSPAMLEEAINHANTALALDDADSVVLGLAGCALSDAGQVSRAIPILKRSIQEDPANAQALAALGSAYLSLGDLDQAVQVLEKSIKVSPLDKRLVIWRSVLAIVRIKQGDLSAALMQAQIAVDADDRTYFSRVVLTGVHLLRDDRPAAQAVFADCVRLHPDLNLADVVAIVGRKLGPRIIEIQSWTP